MHIVMRSSLARGRWDLRLYRKRIRSILLKFADKHGLIFSTQAIHCNHIHLQVHVRSANGYKAFIRATTAAIAMAVTGKSRWKKSPRQKFWDLRPFTRIAYGFKAAFRLQDYIYINQLEAQGFTREHARRAINSS